MWDETASNPAPTSGHFIRYFSATIVNFILLTVSSYFIKDRLKPQTTYAAQKQAADTTGKLKAAGGM
jgi:hypothetical protein